MKASFPRLIFLLLLPLTACTGVPAEVATVTMTPSFTVTPLPTHSSTVPPTQTLTPSPAIPFTPTATSEVPFTFVITGDTGGNVGPGAYDTSQYFRGACESILNLNPGAFMITAGDTHPTGDTRWTIDQVLGSDYRW